MWLKGNTGPQFLKSKCHRVCLKGSYVVLSTVITFAYTSIPYSTSLVTILLYGLAGARCWIRALVEDCKLTLSSLLAQLFHGYMFYKSGGIIGIILMIAITVVYCQLPIILQEAQLLLRKLLVVMTCFLVYIVIVVIALSIRMITAKTSSYQHFTIG